jgi:DNA-binding transcriptional ArsR family regulator
VPGQRRTLELTDPRALRAVAHPVRLALVALLRREGPLTATQAGELLGESAASCSFHLRQLAKYGLVEEAGGGRGRERPWRATALFTSWPNVAPTTETAAAAEVLNRLVIERYFEQIMRWLEARSDEPLEWREAAGFGDWMLYLTPSEAAELDGRIRAVVDPYVDRVAEPDTRPDGARPVTFVQFLFPWQPDQTRPR